MKDRLKAFLSEYPDRKCKVYLLHGNLSDGEMASLYLHPKIRGLLALTHGEGFGLPIFEAVCNGLPVVACDWSGQVDFLHGRVKEKNGKFKKRALFTKVDYELVEIPDEAVWDGVLQKGSRWCSANEKDAKRKLRGFYKNPTVATGKANKLKDYVLRQFAPEKKHAEFVEQVLLAGLPSLPAEDESVMVFD
jgi:glycosyltransferase involved in cell wall biosynthesis